MLNQFFPLECPSGKINKTFIMTDNKEIKPAQNKFEEEPNVVCKMYVKAKPNSLIETVKSILMPLNVRTNTGYSEANTPNYALTILIEKC